MIFSYQYKVKASVDILVTGRGGRLVCETSRLSHYLDSRLTDVTEVVNAPFAFPPLRRIF
jgi:hypothetical protein